MPHLTDDEFRDHKGKFYWARLTEDPEKEVWDLVDQHIFGWYYFMKHDLKVCFEEQADLLQFKLLISG